MKRLPSIETGTISHFWQAIHAGQVTVYPTDTLYGFGANALNAEAVAKVAHIKGSEGPFSIMVGEMATLEQYAIVTPLASERIRKALPGPFTFIFPVKNPELFPPQVINESGAVGFRIPAHPFIQAIFAEANIPIISTSVNRQAEPPFRNPDQIEAEFGSMINLLVDDGNMAESRGSTVISTLRDPWHILRQGEGALPSI